jgi:prepilin-type N-terminal cleavage/methylation domain-containing protein
MLTVAEHPKNCPQRGFTLVELAIVLVIIALLVGGMLVGGEMIKTAEVRSFASQLAKFNSATATFRVKFGGLPGDITSTRAADFGFVARSGAAGHGDGNGLIESCTSNGDDLGCETALFWQDLADAQLIANNLKTTTDAYIDGTAPGFALGDHLPESNLRAGVYYFTYTFNSRNTYYVGGISTVNASGVLTNADGLNVREADDIDNKMDNGVPNTGTVRAVTNLTTIDPGAAPAASQCVVNTTTPFSYNVAGNFADNVNCQLIFSNFM